MMSWERVQSVVGVAAVLSLLLGCTTTQPASITPEISQGDAQVEESTPMGRTGLADVISVQASGNPDAYQFSVQITSPDKGCDQYADWWEVLTPEGGLVYRRILEHSHVDEQPFVRSGGPIAIGGDTIVWIRAHMHPDGYGGMVMRGTVRGGFEAVEVGEEFAAGLDSQPPLPTGCAF